MRNPLSRSLLASVLLLLLAAPFAGGSDDFPARESYPDVQFIYTDQLSGRLAEGTVVVVDVRSKIEYDVIHVDGAVHIPLSKMTFTRDLTNLVAAHPGKDVVFYCNGVTCLKSYEAVKKAMEAGFTNCYAYDSGIPAWAKEYPQLTYLLGKQIENADEQLIPKANFKARCVDFDRFKDLADEGSTMVIDVRDKVQAAADLPELNGVREIPLDVFIPNFVQKGQNMDKHLLIYDQVGKQARWLMYYLVEAGYEDFTFLSGGATSVLKSQQYHGGKVISAGMK